MSTHSTTDPENNTLDAIRQRYQYNYTYLPPIAMVDQLPPEESPSEEWFRLLIKPLREIFINTLVANRGGKDADSLPDEVGEFVSEVLQNEGILSQMSLRARILKVVPLMLLKRPSRELNEVDDLLLSLFKDIGLTVFRDLLSHASALLSKGQSKGRAKSLQDYEKLFARIELPAIAKLFQKDDWFAYLRVGGYNPLIIERVRALSDRFPVTDDHYQGVMGRDDSLAIAAEEGRLYVADYHLLDGALNGTFPSEQKYAYAPLALFAVPKGSGPRLMQPVAIQCGQTPGAGNPIITPKSEPNAWQFAKTIVEVADVNIHEPVSHLARTHLFVGAFVMTTHRQLPTQHPLSILLRPHFEGTLSINDGAQKLLIAPKNTIDSLFAATIDNSRVLAAIGLQRYSFNNAMLPKQLQQRGVDDPNLLPVYPYRDDGLLVWNAIHAWVSDYLSLYYTSDQAIQNDAALQSWAAEAQAHDGGRVFDFGELNGQIQTRNYLVDAVTLIIFTASAQHAAVNFAQKDFMTLASASPTAGYRPASVLQDNVSEQDFLSLLPPLEQAQQQLNIGYLLGSVYYTSLGDYPNAHFDDPRVQPLLQNFQANLKGVEDAIQQRNLERPYKYEYLMPSKIPQSINV
jgi:arachidonate 15-lipoxygenase